MAKTKPKKNEPTGAQPEPSKFDADDSIPDDMEEVSSGQVDGWFSREPGNCVRGKVLGSFEVKGRFGIKQVYRIDITQGETTTISREGVVEAITEGVVGIDETGFLKSLSDLIGREVFLRCQGKDDSDPEKYPRGVWRFKVAAVKQRR